MVPSLMETSPINMRDAKKTIIAQLIFNKTYV